MGSWNSHDKGGKGSTWRLDLDNAMNRRSRMPRMLHKEIVMRVPLGVCVFEKDIR